MNKKGILSLILALSLLFGFAAAAEEEELLPISTEFVIERFLNQVSEYDSFVDGNDSPYMSRIAFFANEALTDLRYIRVEVAVNENEDVVFIERETLFTLPEFVPNKPLVIETAFEGDLPTRAFAFKTEDGSTQFLCLALSGENGLPILIPCLVESEDIPE